MPASHKARRNSTSETDVRIAFNDILCGINVQPKFDIGATIVESLSVPSEQETLERYQAGPAWQAKELVPATPSLVRLCPKIARIAPEEAGAYDAAWKAWEKELVYRLTGGNPN